MQCYGHVEEQVVNVELAGGKRKLWKLRPAYSPLMPSDDDTLLKSKHEYSSPFAGQRWGAAI